MTRKEAIDILMSANVWNDEEMMAWEVLVPELRESEDERIIRAIIDALYSHTNSINLLSSRGYQMEDIEAWFEKQKENIEKEYVFRPLAGTDIAIAAKQAIRKVDEGDRLVLAFNGAYIPVRKGVNANKIVDIYDAFIEKQNEVRKAIEVVERIDKYIDENLANAHDMKDSNPDKKYYRGWDDALGAMAGILQDVYSEKKQKESLRDFIDDFPYSDEQKDNKFAPRVLPCSAAWFEDGEEKQQEQKPVSNPKWAELTWKDINELERIINNVHYEFQNGIGEDSFGELVLERFKEYKDDGSMDEQKLTECERQPEFKEVEYDFRGEKVKVMRPFFRDDKGREFSTTGQDTDLTWSVLREWCEIKGITPYDLYPRAEWSEEDETRLTNILIMLKEYVIHHYSKDDVDKSVDWLENRFKSLRPQYHGDVTMTEAYKMGLEAGKVSSWKPSKEQVEALEVTMTYIPEFYKPKSNLASLLRDLKKQM